MPFIIGSDFQVEPKQSAASWLRRSSPLSLHRIVSLTSQPSLEILQARAKQHLRSLSTLHPTDRARLSSPRVSSNRERKC